MFRNAKVGDRVWYIAKGWGIIKEIHLEDEFEEEYMIVEFEGVFDTEYQFNLDGRFNHEDINPVLFWDEVKFEIPEIPFSLEDELRKLEIVEFTKIEKNFFLWWDNNEKEIHIDYYRNFEFPINKYFSEKSINKFEESISDKKITKEEFFEACKNVFFGGID